MNESPWRQVEARTGASAQSLVRNAAPRQSGRWRGAAGDRCRKLLAVLSFGRAALDLHETLCRAEAEQGRVLLVAQQVQSGYPNGKPRALSNLLLRARLPARAHKKVVTLHCNF
jgi:hypothetical protein